VKQANRIGTMRPNKKIIKQSKTIVCMKHTLTRKMKH